jgi:hypothetical protein
MARDGVVDGDDGVDDDVDACALDAVIARAFTSSDASTTEEATARLDGYKVRADGGVFGVRMTTTDDDEDVCACVCVRVRVRVTDVWGVGARVGSRWVLARVRSVVRRVGTSGDKVLVFANARGFVRGDVER